MKSLVSALLGLLVLTALVAVAGPAAAREIVPAPPGGGPGVNLYPADQAHPLDLPAPDPTRLPRPGPREAARSDDRRDDVGGDDVPIVAFDYCYEDDIAVASDGSLFSIIMYSDTDQGDYELVVHRSDDSGTTWREWARLDSPAPGYRLWNPEIHVAEGGEDRVFVV